MGQQKVRTNVTQGGSATAYEALDVLDSAAVGFTTATIPSGCVAALCYLEGNDIRFYTNGATPTQSLGLKMEYPALFWLRGENAIKSFKARACNGTTHATLTTEFHVEA